LFANRGIYQNYQMGSWNLGIHCGLREEKRDKIASPSRFCRRLDFANTKSWRKNTYTLDSVVWWSLVSQGSWNFSGCNISDGTCDKICSLTHIRG
jgi:hypothetical protein